MLNPSMEVLIFIEHYGTVTLEDLQKWRKASLRGIIGKLEAQGLIIKIRNNKNTIYRLTNTGKTHIDNCLDALHRQPDTWDKKWSIIMFCIPEKNRGSRDKFRRYIQKIGYGSLFGSLWIKPTVKNHNSVMQYARELGIAENVIVQTSQSNSDDIDRLIVAKAWDLKNIKKEYLNYIKQAQKQLPKLKKGYDGTAYTVKYLIFALANIVSMEPEVPANLMPTDWPRQDALKQYKEIRKKLF
jgi:phenylacetic acid degradation operon negative regulatory protein